MNRNSIYQIFVIIILLAFVIASCSFPIKPPIITATNQKTVMATASTMTSTPAETATKQSIQLMNTQKPTPVAMAETPVVCPPFKFESELPDPDIPENYVGYHLNYDELPLGLKYLGGTLLRGEKQLWESTKDWKWAITDLGWHGNRRLILLEKFVCRDEYGHAYFEIVDVIETPILSGNETIPWVCFAGETEVPFSGGLGFYDDSVPIETIGGYQGWPYTKLLFLYTIDFEKGKFTQLDVDGLQCLEDRGRGPN